MLEWENAALQSQVYMYTNANDQMAWMPYNRQVAGARVDIVFALIVVLAEGRYAGSSFPHEFALY